ncbi:hypothetical protein GCM10010421_04960 [Streptomyces glaucus]|uniref:Secreted protein n=1 Tax=Streptomyces glaucus TaxID=284029 RepID=A0ABN3J4M3_9ACTN
MSRVFNGTDGISNGDPMPAVKTAGHLAAPHGPVPHGPVPHGPVPHGPVPCGRPVAEEIPAG